MSAITSISFIYIFFLYFIQSGIWVKWALCCVRAMTYKFSARVQPQQQQKPQHNVWLHLYCAKGKHFITNTFARRCTVQVAHKHTDTQAQSTMSDQRAILNDSWNTAEQKIKTHNASEHRLNWQHTQWVHTKVGWHWHRLTAIISLLLLMLLYCSSHIHTHTSIKLITNQEIILSGQTDTNHVICRVHNESSLRLALLSARDLCWIFNPRSYWGLLKIIKWDNCMMCVVCMFGFDIVALWRSPSLPSIYNIIYDMEFDHRTHNLGTPLFSISFIQQSKFE